MAKRKQVDIERQATRRSAFAYIDLAHIQAERYIRTGLAGPVTSIAPDYSKPGQKCPFVEVGDVLLGKEDFFIVTGMRFNHNCSGVCKGSNRLMLIAGSDGNMYNPGTLVGVQCKRCPLIKQSQLEAHVIAIEE